MLNRQSPFDDEEAPAPLLARHVRRSQEAR